MPKNAKPEVIPAIDLLDGRCVRLYQGDFDQVTTYDMDPVELAQSYRAAGMQRLHAVDLDGARTGQPTNMPTIRALAAAGLGIQAGGGIRSLARVEELLEAGVDAAVVGSIAVSAPEKVACWIESVGATRIIPAFDVRLNPGGDPVILTHGWTRDSGQLLWPLLDTYLAHGAARFLCTDVARDGTLGGPNVELYAACTERYPEAEILASGGVSCALDLSTLEQAGVAGIITGKALLDGRLTLEEIRKFLQNE
jgi:phosphoribosylformimino-5-aminoimidazole carboxamide ribotide isomerase